MQQLSTSEVSLDWKESAFKFILDRLPLIYVFMSGIGFSLQTLIIKLLAEIGFHASFYCVFFRGTTQIILASYFIYYDENRRQGNGPMLFGNTNYVRWILFLRGLSGYGSIAFSFLAAELISIGDSTVLVMLSPMFASILSYFLLGEPWRIPEFVATVFSLTGAVFVAKPPFIFGENDGPEGGAANGKLFYLGVLFALISATCASFAFIFVRMLGTSVKMPWSNVCFAQAVAQIVLALTCLAVVSPSFFTKGVYELTLQEHALVFTGGFIGAWSQVAMTVGMQREKSATATAMRMSDVVFGFIWQVCFTSDAVDPLSILGAFLVTTSILVVVIFKPKEEPKKLDAISENKLEDGIELLDSSTHQRLSDQMPSINENDLKSASRNINKLSITDIISNSLKRISREGFQPRRSRDNLSSYNIHSQSSIKGPFTYKQVVQDDDDILDDLHDNLPSS